MTKQIIVFVAIVVLLTGCSFIDEKHVGVFTGTVEADVINISSEISGKIKNIYIKEGDKINQDNSVALIDTEDLTLKLKKAENALELSESKLQEALAGARNEEIRNLKSNLDKIDVQLEGASRSYDYRLNNYEKILKLFESAAASQQQVDDAKILLDAEGTNINSLEKQYESLRAQLDLLLAGVTEQKIKMLEAEVGMAETEIDIINNQIEKGAVNAPVKGIVQSINYNVGELIPAGGTFGNIIDLDNLWVKIYIPAKELHMINLGDELKVSLESLSDEEILGKVVFISSEAEFTPKNVESKENKEEMVFEVKIGIVDNISKLKPGMLVDIMVEGEE